MEDYSLKSVDPQDASFTPHGGAFEFMVNHDPECIIHGPAECIAGETIIKDYATGLSVSIRELAESKTAPMVDTMQGAKQAGIPFKKGTADLFRVTLANGSSFVATKNHYILTSDGWLPVGLLRTSLSLILCEPSRHPSSSEHARSTHASGGQNFLQTSLSSQLNYSACPCPSGEQPQRQKDTYQGFSPLRADVLERSRDDHNLGGFFSLSEYSRLYQQPFPPPIVHSLPRSLLSGTAREECYTRRYVPSSGCGSYQQPLQSSLENSHSLSSGAKAHRSSGKRSLEPPVFDSSNYTVFPCTVSSIEYERTGSFYDMTVPDAGHYLVDGIVHHNTGKTLAACWKLHIIACKYPKAQLVIARKTQSSIYGSVLQTWLKVIEGSPVSSYGGEKPQWYDYPNGSRVWLAGLDKSSKVLSSERDIIYVNQAEELSASDWETLLTRVTGRGGVIPYPQLLGDANPSHAQHPLKLRSEDGVLTFIQSMHVDNPTLYDPDTGEITAQGIRTMAILDSLTGVRKDRLRYGKWTSAEGVIYEEYDFTTHLVDDFIPDVDGRYFLSVDFGFTNPFTASLWYINNDDVAFLYKQIYYTRRIVEDHAKNIKKMIGSLKIEAVITDHDAEDRATLEKYLGLKTTKAFKSVTPGIEACKKRLSENRVYFMRGALRERDKDLVDAKKPTCLVDELPGYRWSDKKQDTPIKEDDHGCDDFRYFIAHLDDIGSRVTKIQPKASVKNYIMGAPKKEETIPW